MWRVACFLLLLACNAQAAPYATAQLPDDPRITACDYEDTTTGETARVPVEVHTQRGAAPQFRVCKRDISHWLPGSVHEARMRSVDTATGEVSTWTAATLDRPANASVALTLVNAAQPPPGNSDPPNMAITEVQSASAAPADPAVATFGATPTEGNLLVVLVGERSGTAAGDFTISGTGWTQRIAREVQLLDVTYRRTMVAWTKVAGASEPTEITVDNGKATAKPIIIAEFSAGAGATWTLEAAVSNDNGNTDDDTSISTGTTSSIAAGQQLLIGLGLVKVDFQATAINDSWASSTLAAVDDAQGGSYGTTIFMGMAEESAAGTKASTLTISGADTLNSGLMAGLLVFSAAEGSTPTLTQEGFAFGADDGSESAHTLSTQDANLTAALGAKTLRMLVDATNDPATAAFTLRYQKNGAGGYVAVPTSSGGVTSPSQPTSGTGTTIGTASATWALTRPTAATGDMVVFVVAWDDSTNVTSVTAPAGPNGETAVSIVGPQAAFSSEMRVQAWYYIATGAWSGGTSAWTPSASETVRAVSFVIPAGEFKASDPIGWAGSNASAGSAETTLNSPTGTAEADDGDGRLFLIYGSDADAITAPASGTTTVNNATGGGVGLCIVSRNSLMTDSESIANITATIAADSWATLGFVVKPNDTTNELYVSASSNVAAGGEATSARLTAPSGKTTSNFTTGRRWDDENGSDSIDIASGNYTELEWVLKTQSPAATSDYFDFRVYAGAAALDTYTLTPRWIIGSVDAITLQSDGSLLYKLAPAGGDNKLYLTTAGDVAAKTAPGGGDRRISLSGGAWLAH